MDQIYDVYAQNDDIYFIYSEFQKAQQNKLNREREDKYVSRIKDFINCCIRDEYVKYFKKNTQIETTDRIFHILAPVFYVLIVISVFPQIVIKLAQLIGFQSPANMVFLLVIFALMFKSFQSTLEISQLQYKIEELTQKIALEEHKE